MTFLEKRRKLLITNYLCVAKNIRKEEAREKEEWINVYTIGCFFSLC